MEFYMARALEVVRLNPFQLDRLHDKEKKLGYSLASFTIQKSFNLKSLKEEYGLGDAEAKDMDAYKAKLKMVLSPLGRPGSLNMTEIHEFDRKVLARKDTLDLKFCKANNVPRAIDYLDERTRASGSEVL